MRCRAAWSVGALLLIFAPLRTSAQAPRVTRSDLHPCLRTPPTGLPASASTSPPSVLRERFGDCAPFDPGRPPALPATAERARSPWAILASATLPGAGQLMLRQWRSIPYLAIEGYAWTNYIASSRDARRDRNAYRLLASNVARGAYGAFRPIGDFDYYERMENFLESGVFDATPGGDLEPEGDTTTFNGAVWLLARRTYWHDATSPPTRESTEWQRAESFYLQRAIRPQFQWSWRGAPMAYEQFRRYIRSSNDAYRDAAADLGVVIGNHLLSTVDAYVTVQLRRRNHAGRKLYELSLSVPF